MPDLSSSRSSEFLQERVTYLEESNQRFISILEMLASSSEFQGDLSNAKDAAGIFTATINQLRRLFTFNALGFLENLDDGSFELRVVEPSADFSKMQSYVDTRLMDGTFAWALNRNQAVLVPTEHSETLILQVVATQKSIRGMFVATLPGSSTALDAASLNALSIVLYTCAYALESTMLYGMLHDHTLHLENRVLLRTRDLEEARKQAEAANRAKSDFLANMSHEIRTPMNGVMGMTELMLQGNLSPQKQQFYLRAIKDSADSLLLIINDILDFSKIEAGKFVLENSPFVPGDVLERCLAVLTVRAEEKGLEIHRTIDPSVPDCLIGDQGRLCQILTNLIGNAIKFCQQGRITVEILASSRTEQSVCLHFRISDTGIGISSEASERIFNQFEQADGSTTRKYGGTGLGLAICKKLVELMGGSIWVESELGVGSCFQFTANFGIGAHDHRSVFSEDGPATIHACRTSLSILLADDVEINRVLIQGILEPLGHRITTAVNGFEALKLFSEHLFDVVLMDIQMPEMDGLQATRAIRLLEQNQKRTKPTPIIAMTAFAGNEDRQMCLDAGMSDYLTKPIHSAKLRQLLESLPDSPQSAQVRCAAPVSITIHTEGAAQSDEEKIFDHQELIERLGGKSELIPKFIGYFCNSTAPHIEELETALHSHDVKAVQHAAHAIKGSSGNIAARRMHSIASQLENSAKSGDLSTAQDQISLLTNEYAIFLKEAAVLGFLKQT